MTYIFFTLLATLPVFAIAYEPFVCLDHGCIRGILKNDTRGDLYDAFLGIPFAQPPVGNLRLRNPVPIKPWGNVLNATEVKPDCLQMNALAPGSPIYGEEDCLYLNVYRPQINNKASLSPVMIYIFGGGFFSGSADPGIVGPEFFMENGEVILVTIAYRLGPLGFLSTGDKEMPGNFGLKDQKTAIEFIKNNIYKFGGDPDLITVFGQSAGGVSTHLQVLATPPHKKLFKHAIIMSGVATVPFGLLSTDPLEQARLQASFLGVSSFETLSTRQIAKALRQANASQLLQSGNNFKYFDVDPLTVFIPVIEQPGTGAFLTKDPMEIIKSGEYNKIPSMIGMVPNEGAVRSLSISENPSLKEKFNDNFDDLLLMSLEFPDNSKDDYRLEQVVDYYFDGQHELNNLTSQGFTDMITDRGFYYPFFKVKEVHRHDQNGAPLYIYDFKYRGTLSYSFLYAGNTNNYGVVHCDDLIYLFNSPTLFPNNFAENTPDKMVSQDFVDYFVHFAVQG
ncbi:CES2.2 family protein [Megaselia abdita]